MKKTTRLTALILALVLLLANISASATEIRGIPLEDLNAETYASLLTGALSVGLAASSPCGKNNPYCASVTKIVAMNTAQERYDYLAAKSELEAIGILMHYHDYKDKHTAEDVICLCKYPYFTAEHVPGGIDQPVECPWHFANLSVSEQYAFLARIEKTQREPYINSIQDADKKELLNAYLSYEEGTYTTPCDPTNCEYVAKYNVDFFSMNTFSLYEYLYNLYNNTLGADGFPSLEYIELVAHLRDAHIAEEVYCQCQSFDMSNPDHAFGTTMHSNSTVGGETIICPWRFDRLTTAEQAQVYSGLSTEEKAEYYALLSAQQKADLDAFMSGVGQTNQTITAKDPDNTEATLVTASITVPAGVFGADVKHVMEAGEALMTTEKAGALNAVFTGHTLAAFDISFYNLNRPGEELQPVNGTVPLTFTVDVSNVDGDTMQVYHLIENADGSFTAEAVGEPITVDKSKGTQEITINAGSFSTYTIGALCSGNSETCGYFDFAQLSGFKRAEYLESLVDEKVTDDSWNGTWGDQYDYFIGHLESYHKDATEVCLCMDYKMDPAAHGYGSLNHSESAPDFHYNNVVCPWRFTEIPVEDQYIVISGLTDETEEQEYLTALEEAGKLDEYEAYVASLTKPLSVRYAEYNALETDEAKKAYLESLPEEIREQLLRVNAVDYTATAENGNSVEISVPAGAFSEDYLLEVFNKVEEEIDVLKSAADATVGGPTEHVANFDISFGSLSGEKKLQPNQAVSLIFTVPTESLPRMVAEDGSEVVDPYLYVFHMVENEEGTYTAELVDSMAVEAEADFQTLEIEAEEFSIYYIASGNMSMGNKEDRGEIGSNTNDTYYTMPGATMYFFVNTNNTVTWSAELPTGITGISNGISYEGKPAYQITIPASFEPGENGTSFQLKATWMYGYRTGTVTIVVLSLQKFVEHVLNASGSSDGDFDDYPVYVAVLQNKENSIGIPAEPGQSGAGYNFIETGYTTGTNKADYFQSPNGTGIINPAIGGHVGMIPSVDGTNTIGLVDPSGVETKAMLTGIDWVSVRNTIFAIDETRYDTEGEVVDKDQPDNYEIIPYVIKLETTNDMQGWHIDCAVRKKASVTLTYDNNIPSGLKLDTSIKLPNNVTTTQGNEVEVGAITGMNNGTINVSGIQDSTEKYTFTFVEWNTKPDGSGAGFSPNEDIKLDENTTLYAIWNSNPAIGTGDLLIRKNVTAHDGEEINIDQSFAFTVTISNATAGSNYRYTVYNMNNIAESTGTIVSGGTINLKHGQYALIEDLPAVNEENGAANITVIENANEDYTASWDSGSTESMQTTVKIEGGRRSEITCTNTPVVKNGSLTITKEVKDSEFKTDDPDRVFTFTVTPDGGSPSEGKTITVSAANKANRTANTVTFDNLPAGWYTVNETNATGGTYQTTYDEAQKVEVKAGQTTIVNVTNTAKATTTVIATKVWDDNSNALGLRPDGVALTLYANSVEVTTDPTVDKTAGDQWTYTWSVDKYDGNGNAINYTVDELNVPTNYQKSVEGMTVTNSIMVGKLIITKTVQKSDYAEQTFSFNVDGATNATQRITVPVTAGSSVHQKIGDAIVLPAGTYTVTEDAVNGYTTTYEPATKQVTVNAGETATITVINTASEDRTIRVTKTWDDKDDELGVRPDSVTVNLMNGNTTVGTKSLTGTAWSDSWTVSKYDGSGNVIDYTVTENPVTYYKGEVTGNIEQGFTVTNTLETGSLKITKEFATGVTPEAGETFLFHVIGPNNYKADVVIKGEGSVTISNLVAGGVYTVIEDENWSWRYTGTSDQTDNLVTIPANGTGEITFTNTKDNDQWLDGNAYAENNFNGSTITSERVPAID